MLTHALSHTHIRTYTLVYTLGLHWYYCSIVILKLQNRTNAILGSKSANIPNISDLFGEFVSNISYLFLMMCSFLLV